MNWLPRLSLAAALFCGFIVIADEAEASRVDIPFTHCLDDDAVPVNGCRAYTFLANTSTVEQLYSDKARTVVHGDFVTADSAGRFPNAYADPATCLKIEFRESDGSTVIDTIDDVCPEVDASSTADSLAALGLTGSAAGEAVGTSGDALCLMNTACTWSALQTFTSGTEHISTGADATAGPSVDIYRNSASPLASDETGEIRWYGEDSVGNKEEYVTDGVQITDPTSTNEDATRHFSTVVAGTLAKRLNIGAGVWTNGATGGDQGVDTVNASNFYKDGSVIFETFTGSAVAYDDDATTTFAHGLGCTPDIVQAYLINTTTDNGYATDERLYLSTHNGTDADNNATVTADDTNVYVTLGTIFNLVSKSTFNTVNLTEGNWNVNVFAACFN